MSRINPFPEGHGPEQIAWTPPARKRKRRRKPVLRIQLTAARRPRNSRKETP